jgi:hypothetical protein
VTSLEITQQERARWQRRAAAELGGILAAHPGLPCITWTVGPAGSVLIGHVSGLAPAAHVREAFIAWRLALDLEDYREHPMSGATTRLHAAARRGEVRVRLTATVFGEDGDEA